jgi:hypothetical protein
MHARPGQGRITDIGKDSDIPIMAASDRGRLATPFAILFVCNACTVQRCNVHNVYHVCAQPIACPRVSWGPRVDLSAPSAHACLLTTAHGLPLNGAEVNESMVNTGTSRTGCMAAIQKSHLLVSFRWESLEFLV